MEYILILYKDNGKVEVGIFLTRNAVRVWLIENESKYMTYDVYMARCINNKMIDLFTKKNYNVFKR